jgi:alpha-tubulin suppressor-like RCC1 family protein
MKTDGTISCWGAGLPGTSALGFPNYGQATPPAGTFASVSASSDHTCGVKTNGMVACWGDNSSGQATPPAGTFASVSAGACYTCGVKTDGSVECWGCTTAQSGEARPPTM